MQLAKDRDLFVIEDCAQAHGARYRGSLLDQSATSVAGLFAKTK